MTPDDVIARRGVAREPVDMYSTSSHRRANVVVYKDLGPEEAEDYRDIYTKSKELGPSPTIRFNASYVNVY